MSEHVCAANIEIRRVIPFREALKNPTTLPLPDHGGSEEVLASHQELPMPEMGDEPVRSNDADECPWWCGVCGTRAENE